MCCGEWVNICLIFVCTQVYSLYCILCITNWGHFLWVLLPAQMHSSISKLCFQIRIRPFVLGPCFQVSNIGMIYLLEMCFVPLQSVCLGWSMPSLGLHSSNVPGSQLNHEFLPRSSSRNHTSSSIVLSALLSTWPV